MAVAIFIDAIVGQVGYAGTIGIAERADRSANTIGHASFAIASAASYRRVTGLLPYSLCRQATTTSFDVRLPPVYPLRKALFIGPCVANSCNAPDLGCVDGIAAMRF
jgi:hypothetical protein